MAACSMAKVCQNHSDDAWNDKPFIIQIRVYRGFELDVLIGKESLDEGMAPVSANTFPRHL